MALGVNGINQNIFLKPAETISGAELSKVAQEILSAKSPASSFSSLSFGNANFGRNVDVSLFGASASSDTNAVKLAATNNAAYDVTLSQKTLSAVNALNAKAAADTINNITQFRNGLIHINAEQPALQGLKGINPAAVQTEVFGTMNLSKDRKGSNPFFAPRAIKKDVKNEKSLNLTA